MALLTQELLLHADRCMRHEDVSKKIMLADLNRTLDEWLCDSIAELSEEMGLWKWDDATEDFWSRLAKAMRIERIRGSCLDTDSEVWGLDQTTWELMWAGEAAI